MTNALWGWDEVERRIGLLAPERQAAFALACAEHLVTGERSPRQAELRSMLDQGWMALIDGTPANLSHLRQVLEERDDLDDDEVAAVAYALGAVSGSVDDARWGAGRGRDAAYGRVPYPEDARTFRPLEEDTQSPEVQAELAWQRSAVSQSEDAGSLADLIAQFRAASR